MSTDGANMLTEAGQGAATVMSAIKAKRWASRARSKIQQRGVRSSGLPPSRRESRPQLGRTRSGTVRVSQAQSAELRQRASREYAQVVPTEDTQQQLRSLVKYRRTVDAGAATGAGAAAAAAANDARRASPSIARGARPSLVIEGGADGISDELRMLQSMRRKGW